MNDAKLLKALEYVVTSCFNRMEAILRDQDAGVNLNDLLADAEKDRVSTIRFIRERILNEPEPAASATKPKPPAANASNVWSIVLVAGQTDRLDDVLSDTFAQVPGVHVVVINAAKDGTDRQMTRDVTSRHSSQSKAVVYLETNGDTDFNAAYSLGMSAVPDNAALVMLKRHMEPALHCQVFPPNAPGALKPFTVVYEWDHDEDCVELVHAIDARDAIRALRAEIRFHMAEGDLLRYRITHDEDWSRVHVNAIFPGHLQSL